MSESETDIEFVSDMEWLHSHDREAALPPEKLIRLFALARRGAEAADEIERLREALREIAERHVPDQPSALDMPEEDYVRRQHTELRRIARAALKEDGE